MSEEKKGFFGRLVAGLTKTRDNIVSGIDAVFRGFSKIDEEFYEELEEILIMGDLGVKATEAILDDLRDKVKENHIKDPAECKQLLIDSIKEQMKVEETAYRFENEKSVVLVIGVNGVGKTTTVGKLAGKLKSQGKKGEMIEVSEGYGRNFLLPRKLAIAATADAINTMNLKEKARRAEEAANRQAAVEMGGKLKNVTVKLTAKGGKEGKLFGAITSKEISEGLASQFQLGLNLDQSMRQWEIGEALAKRAQSLLNEVKAKLGYEVSARFSVSVSEE